MWKQLYSSFFSLHFLVVWDFNYVYVPRVFFLYILRVYLFWDLLQLQQSQCMRKNRWTCIISNGCDFFCAGSNNSSCSIWIHTQWHESENMVGLTGQYGTDLFAQLLLKLMNMDFKWIRFQIKCGHVCSNNRLMNEWYRGQS